MKESIIAYNVIPTKGKLNQISFTENGKKTNFATRINNRNSEKSKLSPNYAYKIDVDGESEDVLGVLKTLHEYGISWKRNGEFYNNNPTNYLVFDFDCLSETATLAMQNYVQKHRNECILFKSNSYNTKLDKRSFKLYHIVESMEPSEEAFRTAYDRLAKDIFGWTYNDSSWIYEAKPDLHFAQNLFQVVYNHLNSHVAEKSIRFIKKNATYRFAISNLNQWDDDPNDVDAIPTENARKEWKHEYGEETVHVFKYRNFGNLFPSCTVTDCFELGYIPNKAHATKPFTQKEYNQARKQIVNQEDGSSKEVLSIRKSKPSNYGCIRNLETELDRKFMHVYRTLPVTWTDFCKSFNLHYHTTKVFAPYYGIYVCETYDKKGIGGRHKRFLVPMVIKCIFNLIVANHILRCNHIEFQFDLYAVLAHVKLYIIRRFSELDDFRKDHSDEQLYDLIYKLYTNFSIKEQLGRYLQENGVCLRRSNLTEENRTKHIEHLYELLNGNWKQFNRQWFRSVLSKDSSFEGINTEALYKWVMENRRKWTSEKDSQETEDIVKRGSYQSRHSCLQGKSTAYLNKYCIENQISPSNKRALKKRYRITD